ncbi:MAG: peptidyl-prolyl cis-trans isomerase [Caldimicrobium sp.]
MDEKALESYFHAHRDMYVEEEKVKIAYMKLPFEGEVEVSEEELKNYYSQNLTRFREPFKVKMRQLIIPGVSEVSLKKAEEEKKKVKEIKDFALFGVTKGEWFEEDALPQEIIHIIKNSKAGDILGPLKTSQGYLILGIEEIKPESILKFEEVKNKLIEELKKEKIKEKVKAKANEIYSQIVRENSLKLWAEKRGIKVNISEYLSLEDLAKLFYSRELAQKVFKGGKGEYLSPLEAREAIYLVEILDKKPKRNLNFEEAKEKVKRDYLNEQGKEICEAKVQNFLEKSKTHKDYDTLAKDLGFKVNKIEVQRKDLPEEIIHSFTQIGLINKPLWGEREVKLIQLIKISPSDKMPSEEELSSIAQLLRKYKGEALLKNIMDNYQKKAKIKIYPLFQQL